MMRKTIAKRLTGAWQDAPAFFLTARLDCVPWSPSAAPSRRPV